MSFQHRQVRRGINSVRRQDEADPGPHLGPSRPATSTNVSSDSPQFANSPLPPAMLAVAHHDSPENRRALYESMFKTWFLVPTMEAVSETPGFHDIQENTAATFSLEHDSAG